MRKFDFAIQTFLIGGAALLLLAGLIQDRGYFIFIWILQFLTGVWQLLSATATSSNTIHGNPERTKMIRIYWGWVAGYFIILALLYVFSIYQMITLVWFFSAWLIAGYYYIFTIRLAFMNPVRKTFLDVAG